jgi:hypothetical protein
MTRALYRCLLQLHPPWFRRQFAGEMLWIFEEASASEGTVALFFDGLLSLARQWLLRSGSWKIALAIVGGLLEITAGGLSGPMASFGQVAAHQFSGHWSGTLRAHGTRETMDLTLAKTGAAWTGEMRFESPSIASAEVFPISNVTSKWPSLRFTVKTPDGVWSFDGRLAPRSRGSRLQGSFEAAAGEGNWELAKQEVPY